MPKLGKVAGYPKGEIVVGRSVLSDNLLNQWDSLVIDTDEKPVLDLER